MQQRFNAAFVAILTLAGFGRGQSAKAEAAKGAGHPIHRKYLHTNDVAKATGRGCSAYLGYCHGEKETERRLFRMCRERGIDTNDNAAVRAFIQDNRLTQRRRQTTGYAPVPQAPTSTVWEWLTSW